MDNTTFDAIQFFDGRPQELELWLIFRPWLEEHFPSVSLDVQKTQLTFRSPKFFCAVSLRRFRRLPPHCLVLTFGLRRPLDHPRIICSAHPTPSRWTHHTALSHPDQLDSQLLAWLTEALADCPPPV